MCESKEVKVTNLWLIKAFENKAAELRLYKEEGFLPGVRLQGGEGQLVESFLRKRVG